MSHEEIYANFKTALFNASEEVKKSVIINENAQLITWDRKVKYFKQYRPITLEDVLMVFSKNNEPLGIWSNGLFEFHYSSPCKWLLGKPASSQSDECLISLTNLLK